MKVRITGDISGSRNGVPWPKRGETIELPDDEGAQLCASGLASPVKDSEKDVEKAVPDDSGIESRSGLTKETAGAVAPGAESEGPTGDATPEPEAAGGDEPSADGEATEGDESAEVSETKAPAPAAKRTAAKRASAKPQGESK
ncbi:hypothetical protein [Streptomyces sp. STR69]|uniref:hypothetical protein n=1 Tax=Streptomyces sp. STR69 TaxID=1796942 RepID=UPI0021C80010|nr:hypothetical protein [Streptomyces sp. STR69]